MSDPFPNPAYEVATDSDGVTRATDPNCGYEQHCGCSTWVPGEGWVLDFTLMRREQKAAKRGRQG